MKKFEELTMNELKALYDEKFEQEKVKKGLIRWRTENGEMYWYIDEFGMIYHVIECFSKTDNYHYNTGNYFQTKKQAEEYSKKMLLQQQYKDWCAFDCDWKDAGQPKWFVYYSIDNKTIVFDNHYCLRALGVVYAESEECIQEFIDQIGEEDFKKYIFEVEE